MAHSDAPLPHVRLSLMSLRNQGIIHIDPHLSRVNILPPLDGFLTVFREDIINPDHLDTRLRVLLLNPPIGNQKNGNLITILKSMRVTIRTSRGPYTNDYYQNLYGPSRRTHVEDQYSNYTVPTQNKF